MSVEVRLKDWTRRSWPLDTGTVEVLRASTSGWRQPLGTSLNVSSTSANSASSSVRPRNSST